eukprot:TRINITY_DN40624_c0_g1_i1.p1 TRINITY_DN40624_c0_g1~~TRINITY_DN40624_c0_g1_i1.p1  ORF type:complete len:106 (+),score=30.90 TRINITY_DN40624_c0_g1_i1:111-428(+)
MAAAVVLNNYRRNHLQNNAGPLSFTEQPQENSEAAKQMALENARYTDMIHQKAKDAAKHRRAAKLAQRGSLSSMLNCCAVEKDDDTEVMGEDDPIAKHEEDPPAH